MRKISVVFIALSFLFVGCSSKKQGCVCPYQSSIEHYINSENIEYNSFLSVNSQLNINDIFPTLVLESMEKEEESKSSDIVTTAFQYNGVRYKRGGLSAKGMDCSGFVYTCFSNLGISLPRTSIDMANTVNNIPRSEARKGDLIFFKTNRKHSRINHVGLVIEVNGSEIKFIHASIKKGVTVSSTFENYYSRTYAKIGRVLGV